MEILNNQQAIEHLSRQAKESQCEVEILIHSGTSFSTSYNQRKLDKYQFSKNKSLGVRVINGDKEGCSYTETFSKEALDMSLNEAMANAQLIQKPYAPQIYGPQDTSELEGLYNSHLDDVDIESKLDIAQKLEAAALDFDQKVKTLAYGGYGDFTNTVEVFNTQGLHNSYRENGCYIYCCPLVQDGSDSGMESHEQISRDFAQLNAIEVGGKSASLSLQKLGAIIPESGKRPVLLTNKAANTLLHFMLGFFSGKSVYEKVSPLTGRIQQKIMDDKITIMDDPFCLKTFGARPFDAEGFASRPVTLVENGVLQTYLTHSGYAKLLGIANTGHGSRSPSAELSIGPSIIRLQEGLSNFHDMASSETELLVLSNIKGFAGFNAVSGDFSMEAEGFLYRNGEPMVALKNFVVSGNALETFNEVIAVGNDPYASSEGVITPSLLLKQLSIAGKSGKVIE